MCEPERAYNNTQKNVKKKKIEKKKMAETETRTRKP